MIANASFQWRYSSLILIATFLLVMNSRVQAVQPNEEGEEWLKWDNNIKQIYVRAYSQGMQDGFVRGCDQKIGSAKPKPKAAVAFEHLDECVSHLPSDLDAVKIASAVTAFYTKYPDQRSLNISDILLSVYAGRSLAQIHEEFAGGRP